MKDAVLHTLYKQDLNQTKINAFFNQPILMPIGEKSVFQKKQRKRHTKNRVGWTRYGQRMTGHALILIKMTGV